jgi:chemotaxis protein MotB
MSALSEAFGGKKIVAGSAGITPMPGSPPGDTGGDGAGGTSGKEQEELVEQIKQTFDQYIDSSKVSVSESSEGLTLHLMEMLLFEIGKADIKPEAKLVLNKVTGLIRNLPNEIAIEGHTDNIPITTVQFPSNWHLSIARALNTAYYLIQNGIDPQKISIVGYSEYRPVGSNDIPENRAKNRRVDIVVKKLP